MTVPTADGSQLAMDTGDAQLEPMVGVTTILRQTCWPGDHVLKWAWSMGRKNMLLGNLRANQGRTDGLEVHRLYEGLAAGGHRPLVQSLPVSARGLADSLFAYWDAEQPTVLATEVSLSHPVLRFRGRVDSIRQCWGDGAGCQCNARLLGPSAAGVILGDLKATQHADSTRARTFRQVGGAYPLLWDDGRGQPDGLRGRPCCGAEMLHVHADGTPAERIVVCDHREAFLLALAHYRSMEAEGCLPENAL